MAGSISLTMDDPLIQAQQRRELQESQRLREDALRAAQKADAVVAKIDRMNKLYFERLHGTKGQQ